jgi:hypothetical protein
MGHTADAQEGSHQPGADYTKNRASWHRTALQTDTSWSHHFQGNPAPPVLGFKVIGYIMSAETLIFDWEPAKATERIWNKGYNDNK